MEFIKNLYNTRPVLFYLLLPVVVLIAIVHFMGGLHKLLALLAIDKADKRDEELKAKDKLLELEASLLREKLEETEKSIEGRKAEDIPLDWHETFKREE